MDGLKPHTIITDELATALNQNIFVLTIPYRPVVTELVLKKTGFSTAFRTRHEGVVVNVDTHIVFHKPDVVEDFENSFSEVADLAEFENRFKWSFVKLHFIGIDGNVAGFYLIKNPIIIS